MQIHQLNIRYENDQDRMLVRVNTHGGQEVRLWFTRRLTLGLLPLLRKLAGERDEREAATQAGALVAKDPQVRQLLGEFKKDQALAQADFKTPFREPTAPDGVAVAPLLVCEVALTPLPSHQLRVLFKGPVQGTQRQEMKLDLGGPMVNGFLHLLEQAFAASQWARTPVAAKDDGEPGAGTASVNTRPQYLN